MTQHRAAPGRSASLRSTPIRSAPAAPVWVRMQACQGCGACLLTCPEHAIRPVRAALAVLADRCTGCLECVEVCPADAISVETPPGGPSW